MEVEKVLVRLFADAAPYQRALREAEGNLVQFAGNVGMIGRMLDIPLRVATGAVVSLGVASVAAGYAAVKLAADYETVSIALEVMTGSAATAQKLLKDINQLAVETPFKSSGLQVAAKELAAFGITADQIMPTLRALGDVTSGVATGNLDEMMGRIVLAFGQVRTAGRLMGPEARQFVQAGVPIYESLAKVMGKPVEMMKGLVEEGKVGFADVVRAFNQMTSEGGRFFGMMDKQSQTVRGRWSAMIETIELSLRDLGLSAFEGLGVKDVLKDLQSGFGGLDKERALETFKAIRQTIIDTVTALKMAGFWIDRIVGETTEWARENRKMLEYLAQGAAILVGYLATVRLIGITMVAISTAIAIATSGTLLWVVALAGVVKLLDDMDAFKGVGGAFKDAFKGVENDLSTVVKGVKDAIAAEDWQKAGEIIGLGLKIGFKMGWTGIVVELKVLFNELVEWLVRKLATGLAMMIADTMWFAEKAILGEGDANRNWNKRQGEINSFADDLAASFKKMSDNVRALGQADLEKDLIPLRERLRSLGVEAEMARANKEREVWRAANPDLAAIDDIQNQLQIQKIKEYEQKEKELKAAFGPMKQWTENQIRQFSQWNFEQDLKFQNMESAMSGIMGGAAALAKIPNLRESMTAPVQFRPEVLELGADIRREMAKEQTKGIGFGAGQFSSFMKTMGLLDEGQYGPNAMNKAFDILPFGGIMSKMIGPRNAITGEQADFGRFREFQNLRRWVQGSGSERLPPTAMLGSVEAQDIINRSSMQQTDKLSEIAAILKAAEQLEREQKALLDEEVKLLREYLEEQRKNKIGF